MQSSSSRLSVTHLQALERARDGEFVSSPQSSSPGQSARPREAAPENRHFTLVVRQARFTDVPGLARIERVYPLLQPQLTLSGYNASASVVASRIPRSTDRPVVMIAASNGNPIAFADFKPSLPDRRWLLQAVGASTGVYDPGPVWAEILTAAIRQAGMSGVKRLFAHASSGSNVYVALREAGFAPYANETIYVADAPQTMGAHVAMREQESSDTWAIHQLHNASVPRDVIYAEALTSHAWDISNSRRPSSPQTSGWLADGPGDLQAYARVTSDRGVHALDVSFRPGAVKAGAALLDALLRKLRLERRITRVYVTVRGYQQEIESALVRMGFTPGLTQELLVRYTAVQVRAVTLEASSQHVELGDRVPSQAPSVLTVTPRVSSTE
ncbi:MAG: hypothetical protein M9947_06720 [Thermomicrobiales bacterium]|nr:hypothetical protein [Thermomicrobiales bacterium]